MSDVVVEVVVQRAGQPERSFNLRKGVAHAGRAEDNEVVLSDMGVSRKHVRLNVDDRQILVEDLGSGNGTYHRGNRVQQITLSDGDQLYIDPFTVIFRYPKEQVQVPRRKVPDGALRPARLVTVTGSRLEPEYRLPPEGLTLGRSNQRDIVLYDPAASRLQIEINWREDSWWLKDEASANGTYVNGERTTLKRLRSGDRIRVGATEIRFEEDDAVNGQAPAGGAPIVPTLPMAPRAPTVAPGPAVGPGPVVPSGMTEIRPARPATQQTAAPRPVSSAGPTLIFEPRQDSGGSTPPTRSPATVAPAAQRAPAPPRAAAPAPAPRGPPPRRSVRGLVIAGVIGFALLCLGVSGALIYLALQPDALQRLGLGAAPPVVAVAPPLSPEVKAGLDAGRKLFDEHKYLEAMGQFYQVRKTDPENAEAERMLYLSGEFILLQSMRDAIVARSAPAPSPKRSAR